MSDRIHDDEHLLILASPDGSLLALGPGEPPPDLGAVHFGFQAMGGDEVRAARERFRAAGVRETDWQDDGVVRVQVANPDGYRVELYAY